MYLNLRKSLLAKKGIRYVMAIPRFGIDLVTSEKSYINRSPIIANSFPKSGTHLLIQILKALPNVRDWGLFLASAPSFTFKEITKEKMTQKIRWIVPAELVGAHIYYSNEVSQAMEEKNAIQYFLYRDPRDVVISEAYYLSNMNRWHRLSKYFRKLPNMEERIMFSITGAVDKNFPYDYPNIEQRFMKYQPWMQDSRVFSVKYEELIAGKIGHVVNEIVKFYSNRSCLKFDIDACVTKALKNINPKNSHTFRQGKIGAWCSMFTEKHKHYFKDISGDLLIALGYERDESW